MPGAETYDLLYALFACSVAVEDTRKSLQFELTGDPAPAAPDPKGDKAPAAAGGAPAPPIPTASLPLRASLDIQAHLKRQGNEGALAYSADAQTAAKTNLLFSTVIKHSLAL